jgi:hypothetical protein
MDKIESQVLAALKEKNPALLQQLTRDGDLSEFVSTQAEEINQQIATLGVELATKHGAFKAKSFQEKVGILNTTDKMATEIVLAEMLEFPRDET